MGLRLLWNSNSAWSSSGYGSQTLINCKRIAKMPEVEQLLVSAFYGLHGGIVEYEGLIHLPPGTGDWGNNDLQLHSYHTRSDVAICLQDIWPLRKDIAQLGFLFCPYFPIDHDPLPEMIASIAATAYMPITMSKFGYDLCESRNMKNLKYVPHSVDTKIYKPHSNKKNREERRKLGLPEDAYVVGIVAANKGWPARKAWPQMLEALSRFVAMHDDVYIYAHTLLTPEDQGIDLINVIRSFGLGDRVILPNPYLYLQGFPQQEMSRIYSCFDSFLLPSMGEGFGVPIIEAQSCGVPVIVTNFTAMPELVGAGHLVDIGYKWYTPLFSYQVLPDINSIVEKLDLQYNTSASDRRIQKETAREFIVANYDTDYVCDTYWRPIIQELAEVTEKKKLNVSTLSYS